MEQSSWVKRRFPRFMRRAKKGVLIAVVILILLVVVHTTLNVVLHRRFEAKLAEIKRTGAAVTLSELVPEPVPDGQDAAVHYSYALSIMEQALVEEGEDSGKILDAFHISLHRSMFAQKRPQVEDSAIKAARKYLAKARPGVDTDGREIELAARHIFTSGKMARALQVVKDARELDRAQLLSDYDLGVESVAGMILPHLARFRALSRWVASAAILAAREGDMNEAFDLISSGLHIANSLRNEPILIAQFVQIAIGGIAINAMYETLDENYPPNEHVPMIVFELNDLRDRRSFVRAWQGERCFAIDWLRRPPRDERGLRLRGAIRSAADHLARPFRLLDEVAYLDSTAKLIDLAALPFYRSQEQLEQLQHDINKMSKLKPLTQIAMTPSLSALQVQDKQVAMCDLAEMAMYLKQYKKKAGSYPEKLDAIVPEYIQEVPVDPFTGTPYIYRKEGEGFVLYSVARNLLDDGGTPDWPGGDIVWRSSR